MFVPRTGARLIAQPPVRDLASFASTRPSSSSLALLSQARCFTTPSVGRSRSLVLPLRLSMASQTGPGSLVLASAQLRRNFHSSQPLPVIRDSYYQDNRRRSNSRDGGRSPAPKGGWERLKRAFWDAVLRFERLPDNVVVGLTHPPAAPDSPNRCLTRLRPYRSSRSSSAQTSWCSSPGRRPTSSIRPVYSASSSATSCCPMLTSGLASGGRFSRTRFRTLRFCTSASTCSASSRSPRVPSRTRLLLFRLGPSSAANTALTI